MSLLYADTSALVAAYFADEPGHDRVRTRLLEGREPVVTSEVARIEMASAIKAVAQGRRLGWRPDRLLSRVDADCGEDGPIALLRLRPETALSTAYALVLDHRLHTLDALHLAVAVEECPRLAGDLDVVFVTRDRGQASAARALGFVVR